MLIACGRRLDTQARGFDEPDETDVMRDEKW